MQNVTTISCQMKRNPMNTYTVETNNNQGNNVLKRMK